MLHSSNGHPQQPMHVPRDQLPAWQALLPHAARMQQTHLKDVAQDHARAAALLFSSDQIHLDIAKQKIDATVLANLIALAEEANLTTARDALFSGQVVNNTENRAALHTALRLPQDNALVVNQDNICLAVHQSLDAMSVLVERVHSKQWRGYTGKAITDVVNIGVGGSDLGPFMACFALDEFRTPASRELAIHFVSSIDGSQLSAILPKLSPETTLFILSSKSFKTQDTLANAETAMAWMMSKTDQREFVLSNHFVGVSTKPELMTAWGIPANNQLLFWDWVGGRFSIWSVIGLPIALMIGMANFRALLAGAHAMDTHFCETPLARNLPVLLGLIGVWNASFLDIQAHSVLPYDGRLKYFPNYLTQLEMESNGKSVDKQGNPIAYNTCPILWGDVGPNAQHAFYQLLHQGTRAVSCDFISPIRRSHEQVDADSQEAFASQYQLTLANCLAQSRGLMLGDAAYTDFDEATPSFKRYKGNLPSSTILLDELTPYTLGGLLALYEHKVFVMSVIWDVNPFDQWGVELGKKIADTMVLALQGEPQPAQDGSTAQLLSLIQQTQLNATCSENTL